MKDEYFIEGTWLNPPVDIDGTLYSIFLRATHAPAEDPSELVRVSGSIDAVTDLGGVLRKVVTNRGFQSGHYTVVQSAGTNYEVSYQWYGGGNTVTSPEHLRGLAYNNGLSTRGLNSRDRALPGDMLWVQLGGVWKGFLIYAVAPYGHRHSTVNFHGDTQQTITQILDNSLYENIGGEDVPVGNVLAPQEGRISIYDPDDSFFADCAFAWVQTGVSAGAMTRVTFDGVDDYYPPDAVFSSSPEYFIDSGTLVFHVGSQGLTSVSADQVIINYYEAQDLHGEAITTNSSIDPYVLEVTEGSPVGYSGTEDELAAATLAMDGNFDQSFIIEQGSGAVEWRAAGYINAITAAMTWDASGVIGNVLYRSTAGGSIASQTFTGGTYTFPFYVRVVRSSTSISIYHKQNLGDSWTLAATLTLSGVPDGSTAQLSITTTDRVEYSNISAAMVLGLFGVEGRLAALKKKILNASAWSKTFNLASSEPISTIRNLSFDDAVSSGTAGRDHYTISGSTITVYSESWGDKWEIVFQTPAGAPSSTGKGPRVFNQLNFYTDNGSGEATTDPDENRANWADILYVWDFHGELTAATPNDTPFQVKGDAGFTDADIFFDIRNDAGTDFTLIDSSNLYANWPERWAFIKKSWSDAQGFDSSDELCFKVTGDRVTHTGGVNATHINELVNSIEALENAWFLSNFAAADDAVYGITTQMTLGYGDVGCAASGTTSFVPTSMTFGLGRQALIDYNQNMASFGASDPYWDFNGGTGYNAAYIADRMVEDDADTNDKVASCLDGFGVEQDYFFREHTTSPDNAILEVYPVGILTPFFAAPANWTRENFVSDGMGGYTWDNISWSGFAGGIADGYVYNDPRFVATMNTEIFGFRIPEQLKHAPPGTEILEAYARIKFTTFRQMNFSAQGETGNIYYSNGSGGTVRNTNPAFGDVDWSYQYSENGTLIASVDHLGNTSGMIYDLGGWVIQEPSSSGTVALHLVAKRKSSGLIQYIDGNIGNIEASQYRAFGGSIETAITSGVYKLVDAKGVLQALVDSGIKSTDSEFFVVPGSAAITPATPKAAMAAYLESLLPSRSAALTTGTNIAGTRVMWGHSWSYSGSFRYWSSIDISTIMFRFRLPSGFIDSAVIQYTEPPAIASFS